MNTILHINIRLSAILIWLITTSVCLLSSCGSHKGGEEDSLDMDSVESFFNSGDEMDIPVSDPKEVKLNLSTPKDMLEFMNRSEDSALYASGILPQMVKDAPQYVDSLFKSPSSRFLVVDKAKMRVLVFDSLGCEITSFRMACAKEYGNKHEKGDSRTPEGFFRVEGVYDSTEWLYTDDDGHTSPVKGQYGPRFIRIKTVPRRWPIGIHGTNAPWSIGGRRSHGCIRLSNDDIVALVPLVEKGMPVIISPSSKDMHVNFEENSPTLRVWTGGAALKPFKGRPVVKVEQPDTIAQPDPEIISDTTELNVQSDHPEEASEGEAAVPIVAPDPPTLDSIP